MRQKFNAFEPNTYMSRETLTAHEYAPYAYTPDEADAVVALAHRDGVLRVEPIELHAEVRAS